MKHEAHTERLRHVLSALCTTTFRAIPLELYVFGSYARGAPNPGDLDLWLVYDNPPTYKAEYREHVAKHGVFESRRRGGIHAEYHGEFNRAFKKRGKDITYDLRGEQLESIRNHTDEILSYSDFVLLWSKDDQDWEPKLQSIKINPDEGRAYRNHFFDLRGYLKIGIA